MRKNNIKTTRAKRVRSKAFGTSEKPRLSVFRSNKSIFAQLIDDEKRVTIFGMGEEKKATGQKTERAKNFGLSFAKKAKIKKISKIVFDRGSYKYHGRVKAFADGAREGGLEF